MKQLCVIMLFALWLGSGAAALGQNGPGSDPVAAALISPDVVMSHQEALGLTGEQRGAIQSDAESAQQRFTSLQWQLSAATEHLVTLLSATHVDQGRALAALDGVLALERQLKHTQLTLMIQIKNELTPDQQARAHAFAGSGSK